MTSKQRKVHLMMWMVLGPAALLGLVFAVAWRPVEPVQGGVLPGVGPEVNVLIDETGSPGRDGFQEASP